MKNAVWRGRFMMFMVGCMSLLSAGGCVGLSDRQLSQILQTTMTTALTTLVQTILTAAVGSGGGT